MHEITRGLQIPLSLDVVCFHGLHGHEKVLFLFLDMTCTPLFHVRESVVVAAPKLTQQHDKISAISQLHAA
jgi:hypothetical protein